MKKLLFIALVISFEAKAAVVFEDARNKEVNDTSNISFQVGISFGINQLLPLTKGYTYKQNLGTDFSLPVSVNIPFNKKLQLGFGYSFGLQHSRLWHQQTAVLFEDYSLTIVRHKLSGSLNYFIKQEKNYSIDIGMGLAYNRLSFKTENEYAAVYLLDRNEVITNYGYQNLSRKKLYSPSVISQIGINSILPNKTKLRYTVEVEWLFAPINSVSETIFIQSNQMRNLQVKYSILNYRMGIHFIF